MPNESARSSWRRARADLALSVNEIHVWLIATTDPGSKSAFNGDLLSTGERDRADKFKFDKDRLLYTIAHGALRSILSRYLQRNPTSLDFATGANGKPRLATKSTGNLQFNLSHSADRAVIAVAWEREIGVDIERIKEEFAFIDVAEHFFTAREATALRALPSHLQRRAFYKCWTSKEAFLKAKGTGLSGELDEVEIVLDAGDFVRINATVPGWSLAEIYAGDDYVAALVNEGAPAEIKLYRWAP